MSLPCSRPRPTRRAIVRLAAPGLLALALPLAGCGSFPRELQSQEELSDVAGVFTASRYLVYDHSDDHHHHFRERSKFGSLGPSDRFKIGKQQLDLGQAAAGTVFTYDQNRGEFVVGTGDEARRIRANFTEKYTREEERYLAAVQAARPFEAAGPSVEKRTAWLKLLRSSYEAKRFDDTQRYARDLVAMALTARLPDLGENPVHRVQTILGLIALERQDIAKASRHLLASADLAPPAPAITRPEPTLALAVPLAMAGQWEVVDRYLAMSERFWPKDPHAEWRALIAARRVPLEWRHRRRLP